MTTFKPGNLHNFSMDYRPIHISRPALLKPAISPRFIIIMSSADMTLHVAEALLKLCRARLLYHCDKREAHLNEILIMDNVPNSSYSYSWTRSFGRPRPILDEISLYRPTLISSAHAVY